MLCRIVLVIPCLFIIHKCHNFTRIFTPDGASIAAAVTDSVYLIRVDTDQRLVLPSLAQHSTGDIDDIMSIGEPNLSQLNPELSQFNPELS
jgi:hypothetical protein